MNNIFGWSNTQCHNAKREKNLIYCNILSATRGVAHNQSLPGSTIFQIIESLIIDLDFDGANKFKSDEFHTSDDSSDFKLTCLHD